MLFTAVLRSLHTEGAAVAFQDSYADQIDGLGQAVRAATDGARHMRAMALAVIRAAAVDGIESARGPATEVPVAESGSGAEPSSAR